MSRQALRSRVLLDAWHTPSDGAAHATGGLGRLWAVRGRPTTTDDDSRRQPSPCSATVSRVPVQVPISEAELRKSRGSTEDGRRSNAAFVWARVVGSMAPWALAKAGTPGFRASWGAVRHRGGPPLFSLDLIVAPDQAFFLGGGTSPGAAPRRAPCTAPECGQRAVSSCSTAVRIDSSRLQKENRTSHAGASALW